MTDAEVLEIIQQAAREGWRSLDLSRVGMKKLPAEIVQLTHLTSLDLWGNQLTSLPAEIGQLINLNSLNLSANQLISLPSELDQLTKLKILRLKDNPFPSLPPEIRTKGGRAILKFYKQQQEKGINHLYEAKLLIVGEGGAGKTTLAKKIQDSNYDLQDETTTEGIDIIQYHFQLDNDQAFRINIWDFGGQEIYHSTHQFFLTKRSLYVLVADTRKEDTDFFYWLNIVDLLSENSPILIIKNEKQERKREINERQLRGEFTNLKETLATNLATNRGLPEILSAIRHYISNLPHIGDQLPKTWVKVREALEQDPRDYISLHDYLKICQDHGFTEFEDKLQLSGYLHDLGVCLHFQDDDLLKKTVILNPTWGTDAVYKVLDHPQVIQNLGQFTREDLASIWHEDRYTTMHGELLRLMMNFKLCYEIPNHPGHYIAPQLLTLNQPDYAWDPTPNLLLRYKYDFMPKGILTRFIVEMHQWIEDQAKVWRTGVILTDTTARAEVLELYHRGEIWIQISGHRQRDFLTRIRHEFDKIHGSYERLKYQTLVPCKCDTWKGAKTPYPRPMANDPSKYTINAQNVFITEENLGEIIGTKYTSDPAVKEALIEIIEILQSLQQQHPNPTPAEAEEIIEVQFTNLQQNHPARWQQIQRYLLDRDRWISSGKAALSKAAEHFSENNLIFKTGVAFLDRFTE